MAKFESLGVVTLGLMVLALLAPVPGHAAALAVTAAAADPCAEPQDQTTMNMCAEADDEKADAKLPF